MKDNYIVQYKMNCIMFFLLFPFLPLLLTFKITFTVVIIVTNVMNCIIIRLVSTTHPKLNQSNSKHKWQAQTIPVCNHELNDYTLNDNWSSFDISKYKAFGLHGRNFIVPGLINPTTGPTKCSGWITLPLLKKHCRTWKLGKNAWSSDEEQETWKAKKWPSITCLIKKSCIQTLPCRKRLSKKNIFLQEDGTSASTLCIYFQTPNNRLYQYVPPNNNCSITKQVNLIIQLDNTQYIPHCSKHLNRIYPIQFKLMVLYYMFSSDSKSNINLPYDIVKSLFYRMIHTHRN